MMDLTSIKVQDPELYEGLEKELARQRNNIELIADCVKKLIIGV